MVTPLSVRSQRERNYLRKLNFVVHCAWFTVCYPARACAAGVKQCLRVCVCVCPQKYWKMLQTGSQRRLYKRHSQWRTFSIIILRRSYTCMIQIQVVLNAVISATSYYRFRGSTPFEIAGGSYPAAHARSGVKQSVLSVCLSVVCLSVQWKKLKSRDLQG